MQDIQDKQGMIGTVSDQWELLKSKSNGTEQISPKRNAAFESFIQAGFPGTKNEAYKYTAVTKALEKAFSKNIIQQNPAFTSSVKDHLIEGLEGNIVVFLNGSYSEAHSTIVSPSDQLIIHDFNSIYDHVTEQNDRKDPFELLNTAVATTGVAIEIPRGKVLEKPLIIYNITDTKEQTVSQYVKNRIIVGENSQANLVEIFSGEGTLPNFSNTSTEIIVKANAVVDFYKIENEGHNAIHVDNTFVTQAKSSVFTTVVITLNGGLIRNNLTISIDDEHCEGNMYGLYLLHDKQHVDNQTVVDHRKPNCVSNELYKGILDGNATGVFNGKIYVRPDAQKTNAFQSNKNILLSDDATINTKPQLEIWADDVKCSHGATTGQLDEEQLFYLRARGLGKETAKAMLLYAFAIDVLDKIKIPALKDYLDTIISGRFQKY